MPTAIRAHTQTRRLGSSWPRRLTLGVMSHWRVLHRPWFMSAIAIAGGTGTLGALLVGQLRERGHQVRSLSRGSAEYPVDLTTGRGLERALDGVDVVVHAANGPPSRRAAAVLVDGTRRMVEASAAHHVCVSIVGIEDVPLGYYRVKMAQEEVVRSSGRSWTIVRATQFHELLGGLVRAAAACHVRLRSAARFQPVAAAEVARGLASVAEGSARQCDRERRRAAGAHVV